MTYHDTFIPVRIFHENSEQIWQDCFAFLDFDDYGDITATIEMPLFVTPGDIFTDVNEGLREAGIKGKLQQPIFKLAL